MKTIVWLFSLLPLISSWQETSKGSVSNILRTENTYFLLDTQNSADEEMYKAKPYDILITEIMPDPSPAVFLPEFEYLELYNRTAFPVSLKDWSLTVGTRLYPLSGDISAKGYLIFTLNSASSLFEKYGQVRGLFTSQTALTNTTQTLILKDPAGEIIDAVGYSDKWYGDDFKSQGGWSLERIDTENPCAGAENWTASDSFSGGTPGSENSVKRHNHDFVAPFVSAVQIVSGNEINLIFSEPLAREFFAGEKPFSLLNSKNYISWIKPELPFYNSCRIIFRDSLLEGNIYEIIISENFRDCSGNGTTEPHIIKFGKPLLPIFTEIIITEVLYAPLTGCPEYIEIYNVSEKVLDLSGLVIGLDNGDGRELRREYIINEQQIIFPGDYLVLSKEPELLANFFDIKNPFKFLTVKNMPALGNEGGCIELSDRSFQAIDKYCYSEKAQFALLNGDQGVSLERMNIDRKPGYESFWHSASSVAGFGTPGYANSQSCEYLGTEEVLMVLPKKFTPNNDSFDDFASVSFKLPSEGFTGNIFIFDAYGRQVRHLARNELLGFEGFFTWDGHDNAGMPCSTGVYLVFFDAFNLKGERIRKKETVLLVRSRASQ